MRDKTSLTGSQSQTPTEQDKHFMSLNAPYWPNIAALDYPAPIRKKIAAAEAAFDKWAEADTALAVAKQEQEDAEAKFRAEVQTAAREGKGMPKRPDYDELEAAIVYAGEVARVRHHEATNQVSSLMELFREHRAVIIELAVAKAEKGITQYREAIAAVADQLSHIEADRMAAYDGLIMAADYSRPEVLFSPNFTPKDTPQLPRTAELAAVSAISSLSTWLANEKRTGDTTTSNF